MSEPMSSPYSKLAAAAATVLIGALASYLAWDRGSIEDKYTSLRDRLDQIERASALDTAAHETRLNTHKELLDEYRERGTPYAREQVSMFDARFRERMAAHEQHIDRLSDRINSESQSQGMLIDQLWRNTFNQPLMERDFFPGTGRSDNRTSRIQTFDESFGQFVNRPILPQLATDSDTSNEDPDARP